MKFLSFVVATAIVLRTEDEGSSLLEGEFSNDQKAIQTTRDGNVPGSIEEEGTSLVDVDEKTKLLSEDEKGVKKKGFFSRKELVSKELTLEQLVELQNELNELQRLEEQLGKQQQLQLKSKFAKEKQKEKIQEIQIQIQQQKQQIQKKIQVQLPERGKRESLLQEIQQKKKKLQEAEIQQAPAEEPEQERGVKKKKKKNFVNDVKEIVKDVKETGINEIRKNLFGEKMMKNLQKIRDCKCLVHNSCFTIRRFFPYKTFSRGDKICKVDDDQKCDDKAENKKHSYSKDACDLEAKIDAILQALTGSFEVEASG